MKQIIVKLFGLTDISEMLYQAREDERRRADKDKKQALTDLELQMKRQMELMEQSKNTEIRILEKRVHELERQEKAILDLEHKSKMQVKENFRVATELSQTIKSFTFSVNGIFGDIMGISDTVTEHHKKLQG
jgi:hypothetical protein